MSAKSIISTFLYIGLIVFASLVSLEVSLRYSLINMPFSFPYDYGFPLVLDNAVLYKLLPSQKYEINSLGYRDREFEKKKQGLRALFLGDSFVMGMNSTLDNTIPNRLERQLSSPTRKSEVLNMGVYGYGPDQSRIELVNIGLNFDPDLVILGLYPFNDYADLMKNRLVEMGPDGKLKIRDSNVVTESVPRLSILYAADYLLYRYRGRTAYFKDLFKALFHDIELYLQGKPEMVKELAPLMRLTLREMKQVLDKEDIPFVVVVIPSMKRMGYAKANAHDKDIYEAQLYNENLTAEILRLENINYINLHKAFSEKKLRSTIYKDPDGHFTDYGHEVVASIIYDYLTAKGLIKNNQNIPVKPQL